VPPHDSQFFALFRAIQAITPVMDQRALSVVALRVQAGQYLMDHGGDPTVSAASGLPSTLGVDILAAVNSRSTWLSYVNLTFAMYCQSVMTPCGELPLSLTAVDCFQAALETSTPSARSSNFTE
jgi:hypothetical protein